MKKLYTLLLLSFIALGIANAQVLFFSEYIEGAGGSKKAIEIYNPTEAAVDLDAYQVAYANNGGGWSVYHVFPAEASIAPGDVWVMVADEDYTGFFDIAEADEVLSYPSVVHFNGDDAVALLHITGTGDDAVTTLIDVIGTPDSDPGSGWDVAGVDNATANHTLVRKEFIGEGNDDWTASAGTNTDDSEWIVYDENEFSYLASHTYTPPVPVTSIVLASSDGSDDIAEDGGMQLLTITVLPAEATNKEVELSVSDPNLAYIEDLTVHAINDGTVTITAAATDGSGITATLDIAISNQTLRKPVLEIVVSGTGDVSSITADGGTLQMLAAITPADADDATVTWSANNDDVATIDATGLLTAVENGKVMVKAVANDGYGAADSLEITISGQYDTEVADLTELRTMPVTDAIYKVAGKVALTFQQSSRNQKFVQDAGAGVLIDDSKGTITTIYAIGDSIEGLMGTLSEYNGLLQFIPTEDPGAAVSTGNTIEPIVITAAQLATDHEPYESMLVVVEDAIFPDADGVEAFDGGNSYDLGDLTDTITCRLNFYGTDLEGVIIPDSANVAGIVMEYKGTVQLSPRDSADVEALYPYVPSDDASITDLLIDGTSLTGFTPAQLSYDVVLHHSTTTVPTVTVVTSNDSAKVTVTDATDLAGDVPARTTTVLITAEDGVATKTYTVVFRLNVGVENLEGASIEIYPVPAKDQLFVRSAESLTELRVISITGSTIQVYELSGEKSAQLNISELEGGVYFLKLSGETGSQIRRFVKN